MINLTPEDVRLKTTARSKEDAIRQVGELLVANGRIQPGYVDSMLARETQANTYLGNSIAIPHGQPAKRDLIVTTGIAVLQIPAGVEWSPGEVVRLVVGIAAKSDEHLQILTNLTHVLDDPAAVQALVETDDAQVICDRLTGKSSPSSKGLDTEGFDQFVDVTIDAPTGLHARPATVFADLAKSFSAEVRVRYGDQVANGKSLMSLLKLGVERDGVVRVLAKGSDATQALSALQQAVEDGLEEEEEVGTAVLELPALELESPALSGVAASPGLAIAPLHRFHRTKLEFAETASDPAAEQDRLRDAIALADMDLTDLYTTIKERSGKGKAAIFQAHREFLADPELQQEALNQIPPNHSAPWAWQQVIEAKAEELEALADPVLSGRAADVRDVGQRVLARLVGGSDAGAALPSHPVILIADDLTPSDTAGLDPEKIQGFCTAAGGATSHTAIIARSLNIPAIAGAGLAILDLPEGSTAILDGDKGQLYANPTEADLAKAKQAQSDRAQLRDVEQQTRFQPAITTDGHRIEVVANIGGPAEAAQAMNAGAEGVGLVRTEFLFLNRSTPPSEDEQYDALQTMTQALNGLPLIVRTLDIGGDKHVPYLNQPAEENPFLGIRGVRLCLERTDLFETQLRAILRAAGGGYIRVMFPMIATLEDIRAAKTVLESVRSAIDGPPVEIGMMVEVPSAVLMAAEFAQEVDFFSVGTNDLTQYLLAMDRGHPTLAKQADALHPAVLRAIAQTVQGAKLSGKWVGVCGGLAGDAQGAMILAGLGVKELSMDIPSIPKVKARLRGASMKQMKRLAQKALACRTAEEVRAL
ncbi:phosphoenolpyruvate--protein phosphotransferase [Nodosilinea sp. LEGE 06152]|uniref:phosphoenolpyruvate--protein phosphotransferase n=1 Tax=Nodosilinea sp. LEGE 06152 TaxID=2777966 RepID=UPI00188192A2|nr:phosphoenolpyruvate--protein phosphotransferase [Nodosilinea sp. LEGE 06152]MBE9160020.1 phosphoenolpyruvate--protein phosphotransferase [Nodosilinea sp. LEGE 06152]